MKERSLSKGSRKIRISTAIGYCAWETYRKLKLNFFRAQKHRSGLASRRRRRSRPRLQTQSLPPRVRACVISRSGRKPCWKHSREEVTDPSDFSVPGVGAHHAGSESGRDDRNGDPDHSGAVSHDDERWFDALSEPLKARLRALPSGRECASTE